MTSSRRMLALAVFLSYLLSFVFASSTPASSIFVTQDSNSGENLTVAVNVPEDNNNDDLYFYMSAPSAEGWVAFGFGDQMAGSLIFLTYPSENGSSVTLSPRLGKGHVMPDYTSNVSVTLLPGSGITNGTYVVQAKCENCRSWDGGSVDVTSSKQNMIYALGSSSDVVESDSESATIQQHYATGQFTLNMEEATGTAGVPIVNTSDTTTTVTESTSPALSAAIHAILMAGSFVVGYPLGAVFLRVFGKVWMHWPVQSLTTLAVLAGAGAGIYISKKDDKYPQLDSFHQAFGLAIVSLVLVQLILGAVHHAKFKKTGSPTIMGKIHRYFGPLLILCGIVNGAVGFDFAGRHNYMIIYIIIVAIMAIGTLAIWFLRRRKQRRKEAMTSTAAQNFHQGDIPMHSYGQYGGQYGGWIAPQTHA